MFENLKVRDLIGKREKVYSVDPEDTTDVAAMKLKNFNVRTIGVLKDGKLVGIVGNSDFSRKVVAMSKHPAEVTVAEVMSTEIRTVELDSTFLECLNLMDEHLISHLVILDENGDYFGMFSWWDLQQKLIEEMQSHIQLLHEYAFGPNA